MFGSEENAGRSGEKMIERKIEKEKNDQPLMSSIHQHSVMYAGGQES